LECGNWGTIKEISNVKCQKSKDKKSNTPAGQTINFDKVVGQEVARIRTGINEFDRVLGGGIAPGSLVLLGGEPGIGKSTLVLQITNNISGNSSVIPTKSAAGGRMEGFRDSSTALRSARNDKTQILYVAGEESAEQIKLRFDRLGLKPQGLEFLGETNVETICATIENLKPAIAIVDSLQTITSSEADGVAGNPNQLKICCTKLMASAKETKVPIILVGHVTKEGGLSGPKTLEHLVDVVLYLEGDRFHQFRILRSVKNRFGSTNEVGIFEMKNTGLQEVKNPSLAMLSGRGETVPGSVVTCLMEGARPLLMEIQALVSKTQFGYPQRRASGFDLNRLQVLIAVLAKRTGLPLETHDIFLNVVGGLRADEPAADLAVVLAIASALKNKTVPANLAAFGEIGLGGDVISVAQTEKRLMEIEKIGFAYVVMPPTIEPIIAAGLKIAKIKNVREVVEKIIK